MKTSFKLWIYIALGITTLVVAFYIYSTFHRNSTVMISNALLEDVAVERITLNKSSSIYVGKRIIKAQSRSFENGGDFGFTYFGIIREISVKGAGRHPFNLTCQIKNDDAYCIYKLTIRSDERLVCACDSTSDFYK